MQAPYCPSCREKVDREDRFCRHCGVALLAYRAATGSEANRSAASEQALTVREAEILPAVRADLRALQPAVVRTMGVLAAAGFLEWAVRRGTRELIEDGFGLLGRRAAKPKALSRQSNGTAKVETLVIQQRVSLQQ